jgi:hypothetical protein
MNAQGRSPGISVTAQYFFEAKQANVGFAPENVRIIRNNGHFGSVKTRCPLRKAK